MAVARGTRIGRLCIRSSSREPAVRQAVAAQLSNADLIPPAMPPAAVLIVRRLNDPLPRRLARGRIRPHPDWERAVRTQLAEYYRKAARPAGGWIDPNAEAVLFRDESELLACLALDMVCGRHLRHWWWRRVLRDLSLSAYGSPLPALLHEHPRELPAVLAWLSAWDQAETVLGTLAAKEVAAVWQALVQTHKLNTALLPPPIAESPGSRSFLYDISDPGRPSAEIARTPRLPPPWLAWLADPPQSLTFEQAYLLGLGLALHHAPSRSRSTLFAAQVRGWWQDWISSGAGAKHASPQRGQNREPPGPSSTGGGQNREPPPGPPSTGGAGAKHASPLREQNREPPGPSSRGGLPEQEAKTGITFLNPPSPGGDHDRASTIRQPNTGRAPENLVEDSEATTEHPEKGIFTELGGILYLINALDHLLPDSLALGWGLLDALARALLAEALEQSLDDPIWRVLARLDGRDPDRLPELDEDSSRWLTRSVPSIHLRLQQALAVDTAISDELLRLPGWLYVTPSHVDVVASLESISLPVRRAGLDRDPGWVAGLGRVVAFHFQ